MKTLMFSVLVGLALAVGVSADEAKGKIAQTLAGKLVKAEGKSVKAHTLTGSPSYYVLYHSASW